MQRNPRRIGQAVAARRPARLRLAGRSLGGSCAGPVASASPAGCGCLRSD